MKIVLTQDQYNEILEERYLRIKTQDGDFGAYIEYDQDLAACYVEIYSKANGKERARVFDKDDMEKAVAKRPSDPSYFHNDPLCPHCGTYMIYHFEHCPKCGQKLDWSEE